MDDPAEYPIEIFSLPIGSQQRRSQDDIRELTHRGEGQPRLEIVLSEGQKRPDQNRHRGRSQRQLVRANSLHGFLAEDEQKSPLGTPGSAAQEEFWMLLLGLFAGLGPGSGASGDCDLARLGRERPLSVQGVDRQTCFRPGVWRGSGHVETECGPARRRRVMNVESLIKPPTNNAAGCQSACIC